MHRHAHSGAYASHLSDMGAPGSLEGRRTLGPKEGRPDRRRRRRRYGAEPPARLLMNYTPTHLEPTWPRGPESSG